MTRPGSHSTGTSGPLPLCVLLWLVSIPVRHGAGESPGSPAVSIVSGKPVQDRPVYVLDLSRQSFIFDRTLEMSAWSGVKPEVKIAGECPQA